MDVASRADLGNDLLIYTKGIRCAVFMGSSLSLIFTNWMKPQAAHLRHLHCHSSVSLLNQHVGTLVTWAEAYATN